jgi:hypothetical protein
MKVENSFDVEQIEIILSVVQDKENKFCLSIHEGLKFVKALGLLSKAVTDFKSPPQVPVPSGPSEMGKKVVPIKMGKKK